jgi:hypothetical protein
MTAPEDLEQDAALQALSHLSDVTTTSIDNLNQVQDQLVDARRRRRRGWSWWRIVSSPDAPHLLSAVSAIAATLGRASGEFRRSLARELRHEGVRTTEIGTVMKVSRQRVSSLVNSKRD